MKKIKTVFAIDRTVGTAVDEVVPGSEWVLAGEGTATVKFDGTSVMVSDGQLYKRYDRKLTKKWARKAKPGMTFEEHMFKPIPDGWIPCEETPDPKTGHHPGWLPVDPEDPANRWHVEAFATGTFEDGTYELVGPKISSTTHDWVDGKYTRVGSVENRYNLDRHELWKHGTVVVEVTRTFDGIRQWLAENVGEGLVFHHPDGRMAKIRRKDFALDW